MEDKLLSIKGELSSRGYLSILLCIFESPQILGNHSARESLTCSIDSNDYTNIDAPSEVIEGGGKDMTGGEQAINDLPRES